MSKPLIIIGVAGAALLLLAKKATTSSTASADTSGTVTDETDQSGGITAMYNDMTQPNASTADQNVSAFLWMIRIGEGTSNDRGYNELCGGGFVDDLSNHPANTGWRGLPLSAAQCAGAGRGPGCVSTAAGAYQFIKPTWNGLASKLGLSDFSPASQDAAAIEMIRKRGALDAVQAGDITAAISKCASTWASFSGAGYGQNEVALQTMIDNFTNAGGTLV